MNDHPLNVHGAPLTPIIIETNQGGIATYLCGCGALAYRDLWGRHQRTCPDGGDSSGETA